jgi:hypothetical protein
VGFTTDRPANATLDSGERVRLLPGGPLERVKLAWLPCVYPDGKLRPVAMERVRPDERPVDLRRVASAQRQAAPPRGRKRRR